MAAPQLVAELAIGEEDVTKLIAITRLRTEPASRVARARMLLAYLDARPSLPLVEPCGCIIRRWMTVHGRVRRRRSTSEAKTWLVWLACQKAKELGYPHELWTTRLFGPPCARTWADCRACLTRQSASRHCVQDPRPLTFELDPSRPDERCCLCRTTKAAQ